MDWCPVLGVRLYSRRHLDIYWETHFLSHVQGTLLTGLSVPGIISFIFCTSCLYAPFRQTDRQTDTDTHTHTHESKFLRAGLLSCPLLSLYFEGCFCCCLLKGKKCLTYKISSKPKEKVSDPGKSGLFFGSFIQSHSFCKDMLKLSARQSVRQGWNNFKSFPKGIPYNKGRHK